MQIETGLVHFTLFASVIDGLNGSENASADVPVARLQWVDKDASLTFESFGTDYYGPVEGVEGGREVLGWTRVNGQEQYPFILQAVAAEPRGAGTETVRLLVGDAVLDDPVAAEAGLEETGFSYSAEGELVGGDLQLLTFESGRDN